MKKFLLNKYRTKIICFVFLLFLFFELKIDAQINVDFTTVGQTTWTVPSGITDLRIEVWGGGGGGTGRISPSFAGSGGGGGAYARKYSYTVTSGQILYVQVGTGGISGSSGTNVSAGSGEQSYVKTGSHTGSTIVSANGGVGGSNQITSGTGGAGSSSYSIDNIAPVINDDYWYGGSGGGGSGNANGGGGGGGAGSDGNGGAGATINVGTGLGGVAGTALSTLFSSLPGGAGGSCANSSSQGSPGANYGGGGAGSGVASTSSGGAGASGFVRISYICTNPSYAGTISSNQTICSGEDPNAFTSTADASGGIGGTIEYQWELSTDGNNYTDITGATSNTYDPPSGLTVTTYYRRKARRCGGTWDQITAAVIITVNPTPILTNNLNSTICSGSSLNVSLTSNVSSTYSWIANDNANTTGESTNLQTSSTINNTLINNSTNTEAVIYNVTPTSIAGCAGPVQQLTVNVNPSTTIVSQSIATQTVCLNGSFSQLSVTATGANLTYQWYSNSVQFVSGGTSLGSANGAQTSVYTPPSSVSGKIYYYCVVTGLCGSSTSSVSGKMIVLPDVNYGAIPTNANHVLISQVYADGGTSSLATYTYDFIELYNPTTNNVSLSGWSIQSAGQSTNSTPWNSVNLSGTIPAGGFYLVRYFSGGTTGLYTLPTPDLISTIPLGSGQGKIALLNSTNIITGACPSSSSVIDLVGYTGGSIYCNEGLSVAPFGNSTNSIIRKGLGGQDTDDNSYDFVLSTPIPRNSFSSVQSNQTFCSAGIPGLMTANGAIGSGDFSYQWYYKDSIVAAPTGNSTTGWTSLGNADGANSNVYSPTTSITNSRTYACFITPTGIPTCNTGSWSQSCRQITITSPPTVTINYSNTTFCNSVNNQSVTINGTNAYSGGLYNASIGLNIDTITGSINPNSSSLGTYTVTYTTPASGGCSAVTASTTIEIINQPTANAGAVLSPICKGATTNAMGGYVGGSATGGTWSGGAGTWLNANDPANAIYMSSLSDTDTITLTLTTDGGSCGTISETKTLIVNSLPSINLQGTINYTCAGDSSGIISVNGNGGLAPYVYSLNNGTFIGSNNFSGLVSGNYTITVKDNNNCISSIITTIIDTSLIEPAFSIPNSVCSGGILNLPTTSSNGITGNWNPPANTSATNLYTFTPNAGQCADSTQKIVIINNLQLIPSSSVTDCGNSNGFIRVDSVIGGTAPFIYQLSNDTITQSSPYFFGLQAGNYTVTVTDANFCTASANMNIGPVQPLTISFSGSSINCYPLSNASLSANVNGGTAPYQYNWLSVGDTTPVLNGLSSGTYTIVIYDAYSCSATQTITITEPAPLSISLTNQINVSCNSLNNGSAIVNATGGSGALSYIWNTTPVQTGVQATNLFAGNYVVTVNDTNNCQATLDINISEPTPFTANVTYVSNINCNGTTSGTAAVAGNGGVTPYFYSWSTTPVQSTDTAFNLPAGNYTITVYDSNNCTSFANVSINAPNTIVADISSHTDVTCFGNSNGSATVVAIGGNGPLSYNWNTIPSQFGTIASNLPSGNYTVTVSDTIGCSDTAVVIVSQPQPLILSIISQTNVLGFGQNNGTATVSASGGITPYSFSWSHNAQANSNFVADLPSGSHLIIVTDANACSDTSQINIGVDVSNLNPEYLNTRSNISIQFNVFSNDQNMFGFVCDTISILQPNYGTAQISSTGNVIYLPSLNYSGYDKMVIRACNSLLQNCLNDTIYITVNPNAQNDYLTTNGYANAVVASGNVIANDAGSGIQSSVSLFNNTGNGTLQLDANGNFVYRPNSNYCGLDSFQYQICDTNNLCAIATCMFEVFCRDVTVYTGFSPNGDGINDNWLIADIEGTINKVSIFDRWGRLVNSFTNYDNANVVWDGKNYDGNILIAGTYFYLIEIENKPRKLGWIEITR
jgi:gliding motility-associated-like protein